MREQPGPGSSDLQRSGEPKHQHPLSCQISHNNSMQMSRAESKNNKKRNRPLVLTQPRNTQGLNSPNKSVFSNPPTSTKLKSYVF